MGAPGIFEQLHYLMGMDDTLINFYEEPEAMHELIDYITEYKIEYARLLIKYAKPDALFHHDDWGSHINSFLSPAMFEEFIVPAYKKLYGFTGRTVLNSSCTTAIPTQPTWFLS